MTELDVKRYYPCAISFLIARAMRTELAIRRLYICARRWIQERTQETKESPFSVFSAALHGFTARRERAASLVGRGQDDSQVYTSEYTVYTGARCFELQSIDSRSALRERARVMSTDAGLSLPSGRNNAISGSEGGNLSLTCESQGFAARNAD